jgi:hypothetical protein
MDDVNEDVEGISTDNQEDVVTLLEMHVYDAFAGVDDVEDEEDENMVRLPYVITIDHDSEKIVSVRRNYYEDDDRKKRRDWFVSYKFLPGVGFYGFGLYHMIGGLGKAATGSLRALLDSAAFANMQGGFKLKGRVTGGEIDVNPGEFVDLDATVDDVNKAIMPLPFKEPSGTLFNLLGLIVQAGQRFASTADLNVGDVNPNAPVGSTVALIEQGSKSFSAIHKRLHYSQGQEFKMLARINAEYLPESFNFAVAGASETVYAADFNERIDIIPVSDPNIFSTAQRIAQAQAILEMARSAPQLHDLYEAYKRMYEAIRIPNIAEVLKEPAEAARLDPIDENMSIMYGKPIKAFPEQNHDAHIAVHTQFLSDPSLAGNPAARGLQPVLIAHMDMLISQRAAQVVQQAPQMAPIQGLGGANQRQNPLQYAQQLAQLEAQALQQRTQSEIAADQARAKSDIQIDQAKAQQDLQVQQAKLQAELQAKVLKLEADLKLEREKNQAKLNMERIKS